MSKLSLLKEQTEKVKVSLQKRQVRTPPTVRVGQALDVSGSMDGNYTKGYVSKIVLRTLALANAFDDNGEMDMWAFNTSAHPLPSATKDNFDTFVKDEIINQGRVTGGTKYSPCLRAISEFYFPSAGIAKQAVQEASKSTGFFGKLFGGNKQDTSAPVAVNGVDPSQIPALAIFLTDGENDAGDIAAAEKVFRDSQSKNIYWLLLGVGKAHHFEFLDKMGDKYPNVGFLNFENLDMPDEELYDGMITQEFIDWVTASHNG